jgi:hypothetical protein
MYTEIMDLRIMLAIVDWDPPILVESVQSDSHASVEHSWKIRVRGSHRKCQETKKEDIELWKTMSAAQTLCLRLVCLRVGKKSTRVFPGGPQDVRARLSSLIMLS